MSRNVCITTVDSHIAAENIINILSKEGEDVTKLSIFGKGYHTEEHATGFYNVSDRAKSWGKTGALWGGVWGALLGSGLFWLPGIGAVLAAGPFVTSLVAAVEGAALAGGLSAVGGALASLGIPKDSVIKYETALKADKFLVLYDGNEDDVERIQTLLVDHYIDVYPL
ncbi:DUF1269 domain-containing protein [Vibrio mediterranei]|uniref:DUF1269 domain-containing protein n=1 Tax=Vibrio mediterranei TaxID=689 RepID=UPI00148DE2DA|nr:DUF1269 domain-containing protein [Vibrio mediterranei]NOH31551.1 DUF1269 domain-containing protein [Vibrio mediterranei]